MLITVYARQNVEVIMASRHEEKYILDYRQYVLIKNRVSLVLKPDINSIDGSYTVTSLYFDDLYKNAYYDKKDGQPVHIKFRIRSYNCTDSPIRLEKKTKRGIITQKESAMLSMPEFERLTEASFDLDGLSGELLPYVAEMKSGGLLPAVTVRYQREAFILEGTDVRVTFDARLESLPSDTACFFDAERIGTPSIHPLSIIMEIKYTDKLPTLVRRLCAANSSKLSVSKYALCTTGYKSPIGLY